MNKNITLAGLLMVLLVAVISTLGLASGGEERETSQPLTDIEIAKLETAVFAGGCFWCVESNFEHVDGVVSAVSGYTGGHKENPTYQEVCSHTTGHLEAVKITYDSSRVTYNDLLEVLWRTIDPTDAGGQFVDRGETYGPAIFVENETQRKLAEMSIERLQASGRFEKDIVTPILDAVTFYDAEDYHQDYHVTNPIAYYAYRKGSGRDHFISKVWGDEKDYKVVGPTDSEGRSQVSIPVGSWTDQSNDQYAQPNDDDLKKQLNNLQYRVTQHEGTEPPFRNDFWDNKQKGIYVDIVSGEPLFSSKHKYKSGTGWPSFSQPLVASNIEEHVERGFLSARTEVRSKHADSHLGHVFPDGPHPTGLRYCINSASLRFIPNDKLEEEGYEHFAVMP